MKSPKRIGSGPASMEAVVRIHIRGPSSAPVNLLDPRTGTYDEWTGSGFFITVNGEEGFIVTNAHVAGNAEEIVIQSLLTSDEPFRADLVGLVKSLEPDVALLKLSPKELKRFKRVARLSKLPALTLADSSEVTRGAAIRAIGYPLGSSEPNISAGEVTNFVSGTQLSCEKIVTDAAINPGNSGGPSVLEDGNVIGLNTSIALDANNIGFITPSKIVKNLLPALAMGDVENICTLGASVQKNSARNAALLGLSRARGVIVTSLEAGGWAHTAGLKKRDILLEINGHQVDRHGILDKEHHGRKRNLFDVFHASPPGSPTELVLWREGGKEIISAHAMGCSRKTPAAVVAPKNRGYLCVGGFIFQEINGELAKAMATHLGPESLVHLGMMDLQEARPLILTHICHGSRAEEFGISVGDVLVQAESQKVNSLADLSRILSRKRQPAGDFFILEMISGALAAFRRSEVRKSWGTLKTYGEG